jgi:hypothetical protein
MLHKLLLPVLLTVFFSSSLYSNTCTSNAGTFASWAAITWSCSSAPTGGPPGCGDVINIAGGTTVNISADVNYSGCGSPITLNIYGTMNFNTNGVQFRLPPGSTVFVGSGGSINKTFPGGGSSTLISVGGTNVWTAGDGTVSGPIVLPIELLSFGAVQANAAIHIKWATATEINNDYFTLERSKDGITFTTVSIIKGAGNSTNVINYSTIDNNPHSGISYYRLKQTDYNGNYSYSKITAVDYKGTESFDLNLFPNPTDGKEINMEIVSSLKDRIVINIIDIRGSIIYSNSIFVTEDTNKHSIVLENKLAAGVYFVSAVSKNEVYSKKLVVK